MFNELSENSPRLAMSIIKKPSRTVEMDIVLELLTERMAIEEQMRLAGNITPECLRAAVLAMKMTEVRPEDLHAMRSIN